MTISRRNFTFGLAAAVAAGALPRRPLDQPGAGGAAAIAARTRTQRLSGLATRAGEYLYLPFPVPAGVNRVAVGLTKDGPAKVGVGLFDERGPGYGSPGFRGVYGEERAEFFVGAAAASQSFLPGRIERGVWTVIVPVFSAPAPTRVVATVTLRFGRQGESRRPGPEQGVVRAAPGWYRGDLHTHTPESSDAWASGSALTPAGWAEEARRVGLDFVSLTDHNVTSQNWNLASDAGQGVLLIPGEEMTNWFHGHATVSGIEPGRWLDWRQRPRPLPLGPNEARIGRFFEAARATGGYVSAAHPLAAHLAWQFFGEGFTDPDARPDGLEVWNGPWTLDDDLVLRQWDGLLKGGWRVWANGGSDTHGLKNTSGNGPGVPTTVVYAERLARHAIVGALKRGRAFITRDPKGPELYLSARGPAGQRQIVGGTIHGASTDTARYSALVRGGAGAVLTFLRDGVPLQTTPITTAQQTVELSQPILTGGYVRADLRGAATLPGAMLALTNPIFMSRGPLPPGYQPEEAPPTAS